MKNIKWYVVAFAACAVFVLGQGSNMEGGGGGSNPVQGAGAASTNGILSSANTYTDGATNVTTTNLTTFIEAQIASLQGTIEYGATNLHAVLTSSGTFLPIKPALAWTNSIVLSALPVTNFVGERFETNAIVGGVLAGQYVHHVVSFETGAGSCQYWSDLVESDGTTTNLLARGSLVTVSGTDPIEQDSVIQLTSNVTVSGANHFRGIQRWAVRVGGASTLSIVGGNGYATRLEGPSANFNGVVSSGGGAATNVANAWTAEQTLTNINFPPPGVMFQNALPLFYTPGVSNLILGSGGPGLVFAGAGFTNNVVIGYNAAPVATNSVWQNVIIGDGALGGTLSAAVTNCQQSVVIGAKARKSTSVRNVGNGSVLIGYDVAQNASGANLISIGYQGGAGGLSGADNILIGRSVANALSSGSGNIFMGISAGNNTLASDNNVGLGSSTLAGSLNMSKDVAIGLRAMGANSRAFTNSVALGCDAMVTTDNMISLGSNNVMSVCVSTNAPNGVAKLTVPGPVSLGQTATVFSNYFSQTISLTTETIPATTATNWLISVPGTKPGDTATVTFTATNYTDGIIWQSLSTNENVILRGYNPTGAPIATLGGPVRASVINH